MKTLNARLKKIEQLVKIEPVLEPFWVVYRVSAEGEPERFRDERTGEFFTREELDVKAERFETVFIVEYGNSPLRA